MKPEGYALVIPPLKRGGHAAFDPPQTGPGLSALPLGGHGMILGTLFGSDGMRVRSVHPETARRWAQSKGAALIQDYWGSYLAILVGQDGITILRDPSGSFPCFWSMRDAELLLASDVAWARSAGFRSPGIDWTEIRAQLQYRHRRSTRTAVLGLHELLPGTRLHIGPAGQAIDTVWSPYDHARWDTDLGFDTAAQRVRRAVRSSLMAQARQFARPLIALSGGLDSSIVTACVAEANPQAECLTFQGGDADLDEGRYARMVADRFGLRLHAMRLEPGRVDIEHSAAADLPVPTARTFGQADDRQAEALAREIGTDAFFLGNGGDNIFWYFNTATAAVDRLRAQGVHGFFETAADLARMCEVPRREVYRKAAGKIWRGAQRPWGFSTLLLAGEGLVPAPVPEHPWEAAPAGTPLGVRAYVRSLIQLQDHHHYFDRARFAPVRSVLIAQPIFEACLSAPSWLSSRDGRNRAVARAAFADMLPEITLTRQSKGGFDGFVHEMLAQHQQGVRQMLLDGILSRQRLIDRPAVEALLRPSVQIPGELGLRLLRLVAVEAWLRSQPG